MRIPKNLPNALTMFRFALVIVFVWVFFKGANLWALFIYLFAGATDVLDGYLSRKYNLISNFGKVMDPLADKTMTFTLLVCFYIDHRIHLLALILFFLNEVLMVIGGILLYKRKYVVSADKYGKIAAAVTFSALVFTFFHSALFPFDTILLYVSLGFTYIAMLWYIRKTQIIARVFGNLK